MRLAREMGRVDWRKMLSEMTPKELAEWLAYYRVEPFGKGWQATSAVGAGICNEIRLISSAITGRRPELLEETAFLPQFKSVDDGEDQFEALEQLIGLPT